MNERINYENWCSLTIKLIDEKNYKLYQNNAEILKKLGEEKF